jgi:sugar lactone lactonase YvrE
MSPQPVAARPSRLVLAILALALLGVSLAVWRLVAPGETTLAPELEYHVEQYARPHPELVRFAEVAVFPTGLAEVHALAVGPDGGIYVGGAHQLLALDPEGGRLSVTELPGATSCLTVSKEGDVYVGLGDHVAVYDRAGTARATWETPEPEALLTSVAITERVVFVADARHRTVWRFGPDGRLRGRIEAQALRSEKPVFIIPSPYFDVAIGKDGLLRVAHTGRHRIETYWDDGTLVGAWGQASFDVEGFGGCCNPAHFAVLPDGRFVTSEKGIARVKVYSTFGEFESVIADETTLGEDPSGRDVAADPSGRVLVLDPHTRTVHVYAPRREEGEPR